MTTLALLTTATKDILEGLDSYERPKEDTLAGGGITDSATSLTPTTTTMWKRDDIAEFDDGELVVFAADSAGATTVRRGQRGSTAVTHAAGDTMWKNPAHPFVSIQKRIREVIRVDLRDTWTWHRDSISAAAIADTDRMYDLDQYIFDVALVYQENLDGDERFRALPRGWWDVERQIDAVVATEGGLLILHRVYDYDEPVYLLAKRRPHVDDLANLDDAVADMIPYAAAAKMLALRSSQVKQAAHRSQKDSEGGFMRDYRGLMSEFLRMLDSYQRSLQLEVREDRVWRGPQRVGWRSW
jgi:hypothetical protein